MNAMSTLYFATRRERMRFFSQSHQDPTPRGSLGGPAGEVDVLVNHGSDSGEAAGGEVGHVGPGVPGDAVRGDAVGGDVVGGLAAGNDDSVAQDERGRGDMTDGDGQVSKFGPGARRRR